ncbi:MAG: trypsin-like peptidase domain-containing protein [Candidatus Nomurabacteria bacterium]|jgi:serine protease Do|nr:trypsin-like peptidase domain-containing protein [Candidatus Nomurabacteria bacterium]
MKEDENNSGAPMIRPDAENENQSETPSAAENKIQSEPEKAQNNVEPAQPESAKSASEFTKSETETDKSAAWLTKPTENSPAKSKFDRTVLGATKAQLPSNSSNKSGGGHPGKIAAIVVICALVGLGGGVGGAAIFHAASGSANNSTSTNTEKVTVEAEGDAIENIVKKVSPSIVSIVTTGKSQESNYYSLYFGDDGQDSEYQAAGTGMIVSKDGYIMTNKHVIPSTTTSVSVILANGTCYDNVKIVGRDSLNDVAFLKISGVNNLTPVTFGDSSSVKVGQKVIAIGNALGEYQNTVTSGIVGGKGRTITAQLDEDSQQTETLTNLLQTDAAINPGNSGGPLVNYNGEVIGINTAIVQDSEGLGFAIPIGDVSGVLKNVLKNGKVEQAYLGVYYVDLTPAVAKQLNISTTQGAYLESSGRTPAVAAGSPADKAGLKNGDVITKINSTTLDSDHLMTSVIGGLQPGDSVKITYLRDGKTSTTTATLGSSASS